MDDVVGNHGDFFANLFEAAPHEALNGKDGVLGVGYHLVLCRLADKAFALGSVRHHRRRRSLSFCVLNNNGLATFHDGNTGICRS